MTNCLEINFIFSINIYNGITIKSCENKISILKTVNEVRDNKTIT